MTSTTSPPVVSRSLRLTTAVALLVVAVGWVVGVTGSDASIRAEFKGTSFELPPGWLVISETDEQVVAQDGLAGDETLVVSDVGAINTPDSLDEFLRTAPQSFLLFSLTSTSDEEARFRFVSLNDEALPQQVMAGRVLYSDGLAISGIGPVDSFSEVSEAVDQIAESFR